MSIRSGWSGGITSGWSSEACEGYTFDECWLEYRRHGYASLIMAIAASMLVGRTERGDRMFMAMADRSAQLARDVDTFGALTG